MAINKSDKVSKDWFKRMCEQPTLDRKGPWLLKYEDDEVRIWVNELNKKIRARRERLYRRNWVLEAQLVHGQWVPTYE